MTDKTSRQCPDPSHRARQITDAAGLGSEPVTQAKATRDALRAFLRSEIDKRGPIIKKAGQYAD